MQHLCSGGQMTWPTETGQKCYFVRGSKSTKNALLNGVKISKCIIYSGIYKGLHASSD